MVTNICSMQIPYSGVIFSVDTLHSIQLTFSRILIQKKVCTLIKHSVTKFLFSDIVHSVYPRPSFITSFFEEIFSQSRNFYENNMVLSDPAKRSRKCMMHGLMDTIPRTKTKTLPLRKIRVCYFFHAVYHSKNHVIPHPVVAAILDVILNILQRWKTTITCQSNFPNTTENYQKIVTKCELDFRLNFALNGGHLEHHI